MVNENQVLQVHHKNISSILTGLVIGGGLAGAVAMLLLAPQSGKDTRMQISEGGRRKYAELKQQGQVLVVEQLDHVSEAALAGKKAVQSA
jgi:gas vesicle protein